MKRALYIILLYLILGNLVGVIYIFKKYHFDIKFRVLMEIYSEVSIYSLKIGLICVVVDWISKDWFNKKDK